MIRNQPKHKPAARRREDPMNVAFPHRLKFAYSPSDGLPVDAEHLKFVCDGERLSDWSGDAGRSLGGSSALSDYRFIVTNSSKYSIPVLADYFGWDNIHKYNKENTCIVLGLYIKC